MSGFSRRAVLRGLGGLALGLPALEALRPRVAQAADAEPRYAFFMRQANGVAQADGAEPERYWLRNTGALTASGMRADADRALSELADLAPYLNVVKGLRFGFDGNGCGHSGGGNQVLTAAQVSVDPSGAGSLAMGESVDNYIARHQAPNAGEPLTLYTGPRNGYLEEVMSYRGAKDLRAADDDPWVAYQRMIGTQEADAKLNLRRQSVNDLLRDQIEGLRRRSDLSGADVKRLDLHFDAVRDFELLACRLATEDEQAMASLAGNGTLNENRVAVAKAHLDLIALSFACDHSRAATMQMGDGNDNTQYTINGVLLPRYHQISHRIYSDGSEGETIAGAAEMHHDIDRLHLQLFKHFCDRLIEHGLIDRSVAVLTNDLGAGVSHTYRNVPFILAGGAGGFLRTGQYVDLGERTHNVLFNTLISAMGLRKDSGELVDNFGDPSLTGGLISELLA